MGVSVYEADLNKEIQSMFEKDWTVQQILGSPDQGFVIFFVKED